MLDDACSKSKGPGAEGLATGEPPFRLCVWNKLGDGEEEEG